ncbi:NADH(P)-binding protein [Leifsonia sp. Root227]|uniref:NADH(P)-binding protein n=1 Tax=Leifsonia sp. Root227 TaxID=1736496 RepID=UPI0006F55151|nr:NADH(P)-binding protein [Leifsonia sp. Root227]KRC51742.1 NADH(P)-binding protein [Leifsonia sp. Root227]
MKVAVVGGGLSGHAIARAIAARGASPVLFSRSTGFDVTRDDAMLRLRDADVIVEATGRFTTSRSIATRFFTQSTRAVAAAANAVGARHVLLSIVNCERAEVQGYGYFAGKRAQEEAARDLSRDLAIVRTTQWFEFAGQTLERMGLGPVGLVPRMLIQPVALDAVAAVVADAAVEPKTVVQREVAGPEIMTLAEMTRRVRPTKVVRIPLLLPGPTWRAIRHGALLPSQDAAIVGPTFSDWLAHDRTHAEADGIGDASSA